MSGFTTGKCKKAGAFSLVLLKTPASIHGLFKLWLLRLHRRDAFLHTGGKKLDALLRR